MKTLLKSLKITLAFCVFFSVFYILILWLFAQVAGPNKGNAEVATLDGKVVGAELTWFVSCRTNGWKIYRNLVRKAGGENGK